MRKFAPPILLICATLLAVACESPADKPGRDWVKFLAKHQQLVESGKFDAGKFKAEGAQVVESLRPHIDFKEGKLLFTEKVLDEWKAANTEFEAACTKAGNQQALDAFLYLSEQLQLPVEDEPEDS